ncbi:MAG: hypothetical protein M1549_02925 [Candidatus Dependentiae bacterium]|nr:hypothetical protein [Candidatus Dependentiae bacterium]
MIIHKGLLESGRWFEFSLIEQLANIGTDVDRAIRYRQKGDLEASEAALFRAIELIDFTVADPKNKRRLREVLLAREFLLDHFLGEDQYGMTDEFWQRYFYDFNYAAALQNGK